MKLIDCQYYIADVGNSTATSKKSSEYTDFLKMSTEFRDFLFTSKAIFTGKTLYEIVRIISRVIRTPWKIMSA